MLVVLVVVVLIVVVVATASLLRRPRGSDVTSVERYHSALGTIEHLSTRPGSSVGVVGTAESGTAEDGADGGGQGRGQPRRRPDPSQPLVFDDAHPRDSGPAGVPRTDRAQRYALDSMNRRPRRGTVVAAVVIVVILFGALAYIGSHHGGHSPHPNAAATTTTAAHTDSGHHGSNHDQDKTGTQKTTPTTVPTQIVALSSTSVAAVYPVSATTYTVVVTASAPCWVDATTVSSGSTLWAGSLAAGASQVLQATGAVNVQFGAPSFTLTLNKIPVVLPTPVHTPFVATFQPSTTPATGSEAPTTTIPSTTTSVASPSVTTTSVG